MTATLTRTPSEWLLARFDRQQRRNYGPPPAHWRRGRRDRGENCDRNLFDLLDDHPDDGCQPGFDGETCLWLSGSAVRYTPGSCDENDLDTADDLAVA